MSLLWGFFVLVCVAVGSAMNHPLPDNDDDIRRIVIGQVRAEERLSAELSILGSVPQVSLRGRRSPAPALQLWEATITNLDHWHAYVVGRQGQTLLRLGGFHDPELREVAKMLKPRTEDDEDLLRAARELAGLADPEGSDEILTTAPRGSSARIPLALQRWRQLAPTNWPKDEVFRDGSSVGVRVTILSLHKRTYAPFWQPRLVVFQFSADGSLEAWAAKDGKPFSAGNTSQ